MASKRLPWTIPPGNPCPKSLNVFGRSLNFVICSTASLALETTALGPNGPRCAGIPGEATIDSSPTCIVKSECFLTLSSDVWRTSVAAAPVYPDNNTQQKSTKTRRHKYERRPKLRGWNDVKLQNRPLARSEVSQLKGINVELVEQTTQSSRAETNVVRSLLRFRSKVPNSAHSQPQSERMQSIHYVSTTAP